MKEVLIIGCSAGFMEKDFHTIPGLSFTCLELDDKVASLHKEIYPGHLVLETDGIKYLYEHSSNYDIILVTLPCQKISKLTEMNSRQKQDKPGLEIADLMDIIEFLQDVYTGNWFVENVKSKDYSIQPNLYMDRHAIWSNVPLQRTYKLKDKTFRFDKCTDARPGLSKTQTYLENLQNYLGMKLPYRINIRGNHAPAQIYREGLHPNIGLSLLKQLINPKKSILNFIQ